MQKTQEKLKKDLVSKLEAYLKNHLDFNGQDDTPLSQVVKGYLHLLDEHKIENGLSDEEISSQVDYSSKKIFDKLTRNKRVMIVKYLKKGLECKYS